MKLKRQKLLKMEIIGERPDVEGMNICESSDDEDDDQILQAVKQNQYRQDNNTFVIPDDTAPKIFVKTTSSEKTKETEKNSIQIAPGEGKIPTNLMREEHFDVKAFPKHHPSGKFGLHHMRKYMLSAKNYFNQRLLNCDERFSRDPCYVFTAAYFVERQAIESQIDISGKKHHCINHHLFQLKSIVFHSQV